MSENENRMAGLIEWAPARRVFPLANLDYLEPGVRVVAERVQPGAYPPLVSHLAAVGRLTHGHLYGRLNDLGLVRLEDEGRPDRHGLLDGLLLHLGHLAAVLALHLSGFGRVDVDEDTS